MDFIRIHFGPGSQCFSGDFGKTLEHFFSPAGKTFFHDEAWKPQMDVSLIPGGVFLVAELPGVEAGDIELEISETSVRISGFRREFPKGPDVRFHLAEIAYGRFERSVRLPVPVDPEQASVCLENGFLRLTMAAKGASETFRIPITG